MSLRFGRRRRQAFWLALSLSLSLLLLQFYLIKRIALCRPSIHRRGFDSFVYMRFFSCCLFTCMGDVLETRAVDWLVDRLNEWKTKRRCVSRQHYFSVYKSTIAAYDSNSNVFAKV